MIDIKKIDNLLSQYETEDKDIFRSFFIYYDTYNKNTTYKGLYYLYYTISRFLNGKTIKSLTLNDILKVFNSTHKLGNGIFIFLYYLCSQNMLKKSSIYRLLDFPETTLLLGLKLNTQKLLYWISLDEKYYKMFKSSLYTDFSVHDNYMTVLVTLDKKVCPSTELFD